MGNLRHKRRFVLCAVVGVCLLFGVPLVIKRSRQDAGFRGQSIRGWCMQAYQGNSNAIVVLHDLGTNVMPELIRLLRTHDSFFRKQTWAHLPRLPVRLRQAVAQRYPPPQAESVREAAARALGRLGLDAMPAIPALARALTDTEGRVRWEAAAALASIGRDSVAVLIKSLEVKDARTRQAAAYALGQIGPDAVAAVPALARKLDDPDMAVRNSAAYSLAEIGATGVVALLEVVAHGSQPARLAAFATLTNSYLPTLKVTREFFEMAKSTSPTERRRAIEALGAICPVGSSAIHASLAALDDPDLEVRLTAINTLGVRAGTNQVVVQALVGCLKAESPRIREQAARALGTIGESARSAMSELAGLAQDAEASVRAAAKAALDRISEAAPASPRAN